MSSFVIILFVECNYLFVECLQQYLKQLYHYYRYGYEGIQGSVQV